MHLLEDITHAYLAQVTGSPIVKTNIIKLINIIAEPGEYALHYDIASSSQAAVYLKGSHINAVQVPLTKNKAVLKIDVMQSSSFNLLIESTHVFTITRFHVTKLPHNKNVLLVADVKDWAFDHICQVVTSALGHKFKFFVEYSAESTKTPQQHMDYGHVIKFWYNDTYTATNPDPFDVYSHAIKSICVYDYIYWNKDICKNTTKSFANLETAIKKADNVLYACNKIKDLLLIAFKFILNSKQLFPVIDGVDLAKFKPITSITRPNTNKLIIGWVGNSKNTYKNFDKLQVLCKTPAVSAIATLQLCPKLTHDKMATYYNSIDLIICVSDAEGTPNPILEAAACGKPFVSTDVGVVGELIKIGNDRKLDAPGLVIKSIDDLVGALIHLHKNKALVRLMGISASKIITAFDWKDKVKQFDDVLSWDSNLKVSSCSSAQVTKPIITKPAAVKPDVPKPIVAKSAVTNSTGVKPIASKSAVPKPIVAKSATIKPNPTKFIIITSTQYPRYGGAATCAYELHKYILNTLKLSSACIFFDNTIKGDIDKLNPDNIKNVFECPIVTTKQGAYQYTHVAYTALKATISKLTSSIRATSTDTYAFNYLAPILSKNLFPTSNVHYMITGTNYISNTNVITSHQLLHKSIPILNTLELEAIKLSDKIVPNSHLMVNILEHVYGDAVNLKLVDKPNDLHEIFDLSIPKATHDNTARDYDVVFVCSNFDRKVKNAALVKELYVGSANKTIRKFKKVCVGVGSTEFIGSTAPACNVVTKGLLSQKEVIELLKKTKIVIVPSLMESYGITAVEAIQCGCIVIVSQYCACASFINPFFVLDGVDVKDAVKWAQLINTIVNNYQYYKSVFWSNYDKSPSINRLTNKSPIQVLKRHNILFTSIDVPYVGGSATNLYRMIQEFIKFNSKTHMFKSVIGLFISNITDTNYNPAHIPNIYKLPYDNLDTELVTLGKTLESKYGSIDIIFCKNYKVFPFFKLCFPKAKILFSPSGLRYISSMADKEFVMDINMNKVKTKLSEKEQFATSHPATQASTSPRSPTPFLITDFVKHNDKYLDYYSILHADMVVPNSKLTHDTIAAVYGNMTNLKSAIPITNVAYERAAVVHNPNQTKTYDLMFCAYSWKRGCKNYSLIETIINHPKLVNGNFKILCIGDGQRKYTNPNVTSIKYADNDKVIDYFKASKVSVITSKFDSYPNTLVESITNQCLVITSNNIGGSEYLDKALLVTNYKDPEEWVTKIINAVNGFNPVTNAISLYTGPDAIEIISNMASSIATLLSSKTAVCVYKISPLLNIQLESYKKPAYPPSFYYSESLKDDNNIIHETVNYSIYYNLFTELSQRLNCNSINYIMFDEKAYTTNKYYQVSKFIPHCNKAIRIWTICDINLLMSFDKAQFYFMRGTYYNLFNAIINPNAKKILYTATAHKQSTNPKTRETTELDAIKKYKTAFDITLHHESTLKLDTRTQYISFPKYAMDKYIINGTTGVNRKYHFCFIATEMQRTKNHDLFLNLVLYLEKHKIAATGIYIGDLKKVQLDYKITLPSLQHVKLDNKISCNSNELINVYNACKTNLLFSGRDAFPRVLCESAACGCFNIGLDTMSDGKEVYGNPTLGKLLSYRSGKDALPINTDVRTGSFYYASHDKIFEDMSKLMMQTYDHCKISAEFKKAYTQDRVVDAIMAKLK
ncbi:Glycosyltransferase [uncultured virus]|nr:Glycosyltransferase [uncultured virus]